MAELTHDKIIRVGPNGLPFGATVSSRARFIGAGKTLLRRHAFPATLAILLVFMTVVPVLAVLTGSVKVSGLPSSPGWTIEHYVAIWSSAYTYRVMFNTLVFACTSTAIAILLAGVLAWLFERTDCPGSNVFRSALMVSMALPPMLLAVGWVLLASPKIGAITGFIGWIGLRHDLLSIYSFPGMIFVQSLVMVPTSYFMLAPVMRNMDPAFEEAAFTSGATFMQTVRRVSIPFLIPSITSLATLLIIVSMLTFDVPAIIGLPAKVPVMSSEIFNLMTPFGGLPEYGKSAALNSSLFVLLALALVIYNRATRQKEKFATIGGKAFKATRFKLGRWRRVALGFVVFYFLAAVVLPFLALLWVALSPYFAGFQLSMISRLSFDPLITTLQRPRVWHGALNSTIIAASAAFLLTCLAFVIAWTMQRTRGAWPWVLDILTTIPMAVPNLMMGVALIFIFFTFRVIPLYGTVWIIVLGHMIMFLPVASRMMQAGVMQVNRELEEAGSTSGASAWQNARRIILPLIKPSILGLVIWMVVHSLREFSVAIMLVSGGNEVLSTILFNYWESGQPTAAAGIAIVMTLVLTTLVGIANARILALPKV